MLTVHVNIHLLLCPTPFQVRYIQLLRHNSSPMLVSDGLTLKRIVRIELKSVLQLRYQNTNIVMKW
jgi:hypothetical protein